MVSMEMYELGAKSSVIREIFEFGKKRAAEIGRENVYVSSVTLEEAQQLNLGENFKLNYGNLIPSGSLQYNIGAQQNIGLTYNMRISRPGITYLNPYVDISDPTAKTYGNTEFTAGSFKYKLNDDNNTVTVEVTNLSDEVIKAV